MKVWSIHTGEPPPSYTGTRKLRGSLIVDALRARGHNVTWWSSSFFHSTKTRIAGGDHAETLSDGVECRLLEGVAYTRNISFQRFAHYKRLARAFTMKAAQERKPDLIVAAIPDYDTAAAAVEFGREHQVPVLIDIQDIWPETFLSRVPRLLRPVGRLMLAREFGKTRSLLSGATGIVACSAAYLDWGLRHAGRDRRASDAVFYLGYPDPEPVDPIEVSESVRRLLDGIEPYTVLAFTGTFGQSYDIRGILRAARILQASHPEIRFVIAGTGDQYEWARQQAADLRNVVLTGWLHRSDLAALLARAHAGLATYRSTAPQSLPYKPFEYLAYGLPVVSSLKGEMAAIIGEHAVGKTYTPEDTGSLVDAIVSIVEPDTRKRAAAAARRLFDFEFSAQVIYSAYATHIEQVVRDWKTYTTE